MAGCLSVHWIPCLKNFPSQKNGIFLFPPHKRRSFNRFRFILSSSAISRCLFPPIQNRKRPWRLSTSTRVISLFAVRNCLTSFQRMEKNRSHFVLFFSHLTERFLTRRGIKLWKKC